MRIHMNKLFMPQPAFAKHQSRQRGYVVLISVLVISVVGLAVASTLMTLGISSAQTSLSGQQSAEARGLADACAEYALNQLRMDSGYAGGETLQLGQGTCDILPIQGSGNEDRVIQTTGTVDRTVRKVEAHIAQLLPVTQLDSWMEPDDF